GGELGDNVRATCPGNCPLGPAGIQPAPPDYKKDDATATVLEMRDNANLIYGVGVQGMACGQSQSNSIVLTEKAPYNPFSALPPNFCEQPHKWVGEGWIFDIKLPFAQSIADHWVGTYDSEHLTDQQFDQITFQDYWQKIGVLGKLLPAQTKDDLKVEFINYLKNRLANGGVTMYANFVINNKRLVDLNPPSNKTDLRIWANDPINRAILDKMGLFPNEQVLGQVKLDVCGDRESQEIKPSYPEMMKLGLGANQLFKILEPAEAQKAFYTTAYPKLEEPYPILNEYRTLTDAEVFEPKKEIAVLNYPVLEIPKEKNFFEKIISWIKGNVQKTYAVGTSCFDIAAKTAPTKNNDGSTDVNFEISITGNINKGVHMQFFANGSRATQIPKILSPGTTFNFSSNDIGGPVHFPAGSKDMTVDFGVKMDECNDYGNEAHVLCNIVTGECNGVILPSGGGTPKREACDPLIACCPTPTCSPQTRAGQEALSYTIYKGGSDDGSKTNGLNYMLGYEMGPAGTKLDPVDLTWVNNWQELAGTKSLPSGCQFKEGAVTGETCGNNSLCSGWGVDEGCNQGVCQKISIPCTYTHPRDVDVYNNVPYTWSLWEQAASENVGAKYSGFLALFKPELPLNSGIVNQSQFIMACNALGIKTFDPNRYYNSQTCEEKVNPTAREISDGTYISGLVAGMSSTINNKSDDGCYTDDARVFDNQGNFKKVAGQTGIELSWSLKFDQPIPYNNPGISDVTMAIPNDGKSNLLFYGLGGVCNANKWFSQKVLNPAKN
ncbi:MAG: hypothetical protein Q7S14_03565, partial [bacterium]|nr:hypothetical protein [bacterium]